MIVKYWSDYACPFFVIDDKYAIPGALSVEQMENVPGKLFQDKEQSIL